MIALIVMAMSALVVASVLATLGRSGTQLVRLDAQTEEIIAQEQVRAWVESIPPGLSLPETPPFEGHPTHFTFLMLDRAGSPPTGAILRAKIELSDTDLVARHSGAPDAPHKLAQGVSELRIQYWGKHNQRGAAHWSDTWKNRTTLPLLIKISWKDLSGIEQIPQILEPALHSRRSEQEI